jgi:hypothetical protein
MTCEEFTRLLDTDRPLADLEAIAHVASCPQCARALERWQAAREELRSMATEAPPPFLHSRIMASVRAEATAQPRPRRLFSLHRVVLATAAVALLASLAGYEVLREHAPAAGRQAVSEAPAPQAAPAQQPVVGGTEVGTAQAPVRVSPVAKKQEPPAGRTAAERRRGIAPAPVRSAGAPESKGLAAAVPGGTPVPVQFAAQAAPEKTRANGEEGIVAGGLPAMEPLNATSSVAAKEGPPAPGGTGHAMAMADAARPAAMVQLPPGTVSCVLHSETTRRNLTLGLPARSSPLAGETWTVDVGEDHGLRIADGLGHDITAAKVDLRDWLRALSLAPGRYALTRRTE